VIGDKGYVVGGSNGSRVPVRNVLEFNHNAGDGMGTWSVLGRFPGPARQQAVGFSLRESDGSSYGYVGTGWNNDETLYKDFWRFNPANDTWEEVAPLPENAAERRGAIAFTLTLNGKEYGYVGCGWTSFSNEYNNAFLSCFYRYNPDGTTWVEVEDEDGNVELKEFKGVWEEVFGYGGYKRNGAIVFIIDNKAYICTGEHSSGTSIDFWVFDPNSETTWRRLRAMADTNFEEDFDDNYGRLARVHGVSYLAPAGPGGLLRAHIVGSSSNPNNGATNWEYDHDEDLWTQRTNFINHRTSQNRDGMVSFSFPSTGRAFVGLGRWGTNTFCDDMWEFIPLIDDYVHDDY